jgi:tetratricopeptide (TPR) repeat protein
MVRISAFLTLAMFLWLPPVAGAQVDPRTAWLERDGFQALAAGQTHRAAEAFREALAADPTNARLLLGAGAAAFLERRDGDAKEALERALALNPELAQAREVLGQVLRRQGDLPGAIRTYEMLLTERPPPGDAAATLDRWRRELELHDRMRLAVGNHFTVSFDGPAEEKLAGRALESLDRAYWRICNALGGMYPVSPVAVVLYTNEQFRDITQSPAWAAGAFDGTIRVPVRGALGKPEELDRVLAHEFTHALVRSLAIRGVPMWLDEGLAGAVESDSTGWADDRLRRAGRALPLSGLAASFGGFSAAEADLAYASSAVAVRRLLDEAGGYAVANLLRDLGAGVDFETAFLRHIQRSFVDFAVSLEVPRP